MASIWESYFALMYPNPKAETHFHDSFVQRANRKFAIVALLLAVLQKTMFKAASAFANLIIS